MLCPPIWQGHCPAVIIKWLPDSTGQKNGGISLDTCAGDFPSNLFNPVNAVKGTSYKFTDLSFREEALIIFEWVSMG